MTHSKSMPPRIWTILVGSLVSLAAASLACVSMGTPLGALGPSPTPGASLPSGRLALVGPDHNLYALDPATGDMKALTDDAVVKASGASLVYGAPTWAPQTGQLAFTRTRISAEGAHQVDLMVSPAQPGQAGAVFSDSSQTPFYLYWSPDGRTLSFLASGADGSLSVYLRRMGESAQLLDRGQPYYWVWSQDAATLLAHVGGSAADNPGGARLTFFQGQPMLGQALELAPADFQAPDISPDGGRLLVASQTSNGTDVLDIWDMKAGGERQLFALDGPVGFGWSPAGGSIAYLTLPGTGQETFGSLGWMDMSDPNRPKQIADVASHVAGFFWSPQGDRLAYIVPELVSPGSQQQVANRRQSGHLVLNLYVIAANGRTGVKVASFVPTDDFLSVLPFFDQYERSTTIWSPDGGQLVYTASGDNGPPGVFVVDAAGGTPARRVADGSLAVWSWR
jgi:TolB protein